MNKPAILGDISTHEENGATITIQRFGPGEFERYSEAQDVIRSSVAAKLTWENGNTVLAGREVISRGIKEPTESDYGMMVLQYFMDPNFWKASAFIAGLEELKNSDSEKWITLLSEAFVSELHDPDIDIKTAYENTPQEKKSQFSALIEKTFFEAEIVVRRKIRHLFTGAFTTTEDWIVNPTQRLSLKNKQDIRRIENEWNDFCIESPNYTLDEIIRMHNSTEMSDNPVIKQHRRFLLEKKSIIAQAKALEESMTPQKNQKAKLQVGLKGILRRVLEKLLSKIK